MDHIERPAEVQDAISTARGVTSAPERPQGLGYNYFREGGNPLQRTTSSAAPARDPQKLHRSTSGIPTHSSARQPRHHSVGYASSISTYNNARQEHAIHGAQPAILEQGTSGSGSESGSTGSGSRPTSGELTATGEGNINALPRPSGYRQYHRSRTFSAGTLRASFKYTSSGDRGEADTVAREGAGVGSTGPSSSRPKLSEVRFSYSASDLAETEASRGGTSTSNYHSDWTNEMISQSKTCVEKRSSQLGAGRGREGPGSTSPDLSAAGSKSPGDRWRRSRIMDDRFSEAGHGKALADLAEMDLGSHSQRSCGSDSPFGRLSDFRSLDKGGRKVAGAALRADEFGHRYGREHNSDSNNSSPSSSVTNSPLTNSVRGRVMARPASGSSPQGSGEITSLRKGVPQKEISALPDDCISAIMWRVREIKDWLSCTRVCKRWARLADVGLSVVKLSDIVAYQGRGGVLSLIGRFPNLQQLELPTSVCTNAFFGALGSACTQLQVLILTSIPSTLRHQGHSTEPMALPPALGSVTSLTELRILSEQVCGLPGTLGGLRNLKVLELEACKRIRSLPSSLGEMKGLTTLSLQNLMALAALPESLGSLRGLEVMRVVQCPSLKSLPESLGRLARLKSLEVAWCPRILRLPASFCQLSSLTSLNLTGFRRLEAVVGVEGGAGVLAGAFPNLNHLELGWEEADIPINFSQMTGLQSLTASAPHLRALPDWFAKLSTLNSLELRTCRELTSLPPSALRLKGLKRVKLSILSAFKGLPQDMSMWQNLERLELNRCLQISSLPACLGQLKRLESLVIKDSEFLEKLPESLGGLASLDTLVLLHCPRLTGLPAQVGELSALRSLEVWQCNALTELPASFGQLSKLKKLRIINCKTLRSLPPSFGNLTSLTSLEVVDCGQLSHLPINFGRLSSLEQLTLRLRSLEVLPESLSQLQSLTTLILAGVNALTCLPADFGQLHKLSYLEIESGDKLEKLPSSFSNLRSLEFLKIQWCDSLRALPESTGKLTSLRSLEILDCASLTALPASFGGLASLHTLRIRDCCSLTALPPSFGHLTSLYSLTIRGTPLASLPLNFGLLGSLNNLTVHSAHMATLPDSFGYLSSLQKLRLEHCRSLNSLPLNFGALVLLDSLKLHALPELTMLPASFGHLSSLERLEIYEVGLTSLECLGDLRALSDLHIRGCSGLPESWGKMGGWMQRASTQKMSIAFAPPRGAQASSGQGKEAKQGSSGSGFMRLLLGGQ